uniref:VpAmp1.0 n=1 Tax=Mesomexovis punctatus TaxID=1532993 RepID=NDB1_MESPU|nr:Amp1 precursor [Vaejovis punctatus]
MKLINLVPVFFVLIIVVDYCHSLPFFLLSLIPSAISAIKKIGKRSVESQRYVDLNRRDLEQDLQELQDFLDQISEH